MARFFKRAIFFARNQTPTPCAGRFSFGGDMTGILLTLGLGLTIMLAVSTSAEPDAVANHATRSATILLNGPIDKVFPLFGFLEEKKWSRGWDPRVIATTDSLQDSVFTYSHDGLTATWILTEYDPIEHRVTYAVFVPENRTMTIRIVCAPEGSRTRATVSYTFTALSKQGASDLSQFEQQDFALRILHWQHAIDHYLETGQQWQGDSH